MGHCTSNVPTNIVTLIKQSGTWVSILMLHLIENTHEVQLHSLKPGSTVLYVQTFICTDVFNLVSLWSL